MNAEEIRIKVAECLGWKLVPFDGKGRWLRNGVRTILYPPDFPNSLDACAEFERTLITSDIKDYVDTLLEVAQTGSKMPGVAAFPGCYIHVCATAPQRCEAFLRVKSLWTPPAPQEAEKNLP